MKRLYVVKKYVAAESMLDAMKLSVKMPIDEVHMHDGWERDGSPNLQKAYGIQKDDDK